MNILQVVSSLEIGGVTSVVVNLSNALSDGNNVIIAVYGGNHSENCYISNSVKVEFFNNVRSYINIIRNYQIDIVHFHIMLKTGIFALITKLFFNAKVVCHAHSSVDFNKSFIYLKLYKPISKILIKYFVDLKLSCSDIAGKYLYDKKSFNVVFNAIDSNKYIYNVNHRNQIRKELNLNDNFVLGFVGHIHAIKNLEFICDVINSLENPSIKLLIVGGFTEDKDLEERIKNYPFVIVTGIVNDAFRYYSAFDSFVLPSISEGMPMVAIEAQANGLDCYLSDSITRQVNLNNHCHYVPLNNKDKWMCILEQATTKKRDISNNCLDSKFDISQMRNDIYELYSRII